MTSKKRSTRPVHAESSPVAALAARLRASQLPGGAPVARRHLAQAAEFLAGLAAIRSPGEALVAVESVTGPVGSRMTRIAVVNDDMPFLVDSIAGLVADHGLPIDLLLHPVVAVRRDDAGHLAALPAKPAAADPRESVVYIETGRADARTRVRLRAALHSALEDIRAAVSDWQAMQAVMAADATSLPQDGGDGGEGAALLRWFASGMLTQLGHVVRHRDGSQTDPLGICRSGVDALLSPASYERAFAWFDREEGAPPLAVKANIVSNVHRRVPLDLFIVPRREGGRVTALSVHAGIWTSASLSAAPAQVPRMRAQMASIMERLGFAPQGHDGKALVHALTELPHDLLIGCDEPALQRVATTMMGLVDRPRPHVLLLAPPLERHLFAFVWVPRDAVSTTLRMEIIAMLEQGVAGKVLDWSLEVEGPLALMRFLLDIRVGGPNPDEEALTGRLSALVRGWCEAVEAQLAETEEGARAAALAVRYATAFPLAYRTASGPAEAARDIARLRRLPPQDSAAGPRRDARLHCPGGCPDSRVNVKLYQRAGTIPLSDAVPMLEHFGFRVAGELPTLLDGGRLGAIHDFELELPAGLDGASLLTRAGEIEAAIAAVLNGEAENDPFNRLIVLAGLGARESNWLRAWYRYLRQAGLSFAVATVVDALQGAGGVSRALIELFRIRHDPLYERDRTRAEAEASADIRDGLAGVAAINDDRVLRQFRALVLAILRTNAFVPATAMTGETGLAFKIDSAGVPGLPRPVPWREIFVYSRRVEGIHLRAGPIARGGLRWSDRRDDFRIEVLGLMKAQRVKNAVIVPTGAKGGFYPKLLPDPALDREGWAAEGRESYRVFVRSLLSLTDNIVDGRVVHPEHMVVRDGEDPYFVVAADKGTASFSDTANAIAAERDFWLDDAFASGGSHGYDHKAMAITARGAWLSVRRHFLELGIDVQRDSVRVAGCGDMSGDVFGNGMLQSKAVKLVAAFDHRHIFIDPDPDPAKSWKERRRLFVLPRSNWADYDARLISRGGGVFARSQKEIRLSRQARQALGITVERIEPDALIAAVLKSPVDLLWFGGIGTYVKARQENNVEVGDHANDALRINGRDIRARVVGEGANLGCTQAGRIEYALAGGRINADFIDNSAGVDCSDNEVNIKIALASARRSGRLSEQGRLELLGEMTESVAALVLEDNRLQALALSIAEAAGAPAMPSWVRLVEVLEASGQLDRATEGLADNDALFRRAADGRGLTRPEIAVLLSSAKLALKQELTASEIAGDPGLGEEVIASFPEEMHARYRGEILDHRLRREIVATELANRMVNRIGLVHPFELAEQEGAGLAQVTAAFVAAEQLLGMGELWRAIEQVRIAEPARVLLFDRAAAALRLHLADLLRAGAGRQPPLQVVAELSDGVGQLDAVLGHVLGDEARAQSARERAALVAVGASEAQAATVARLFELDGAAGLARLARDSDIDVVSLTRAFIGLGEALGLDWAQAAATSMDPSDPWERLLVGGLSRDFQQMRLDFLRVACNRKGDPEAVVAKWRESQESAIRQLRMVTERARASVAVSPAMLAQLAGQARSLLGR